MKLILREHAAYQFQEPVLTLGVPEIYATYSELVESFREAGLRSCLTDPSEVVLTNNEQGRKRQWVSARTFFQMLGFSAAASIDIPGCEHTPDLIHDLNQPLPDSYLNRFKLLVDPGTIEHVFDVKTSFTNIVRALTTGGVVIHFVPIYSYNGGYFSINPQVLIDFYGGNGFEQIKAYIIMWDRYQPFTGKCRCYPYSDSLLGARHALADHDQCRFAPHLLLFARKTTDAVEIRVPIQSHPTPCQSVADGTLSRSLKHLLRRARRSVLGVLPHDLGYSLDSRLARAAMLRRIHRQSFWI